MRIKSKAIIICEIYEIDSKAKAVPAYRLYDLQFVYPKYNKEFNTTLNPKLTQAFKDSHHDEPTFSYNQFYSYLTNQVTDRVNPILKRFKKNKIYHYYI